MFRNSRGGGSIRQRRATRVRPQRQLTFKVSMLKNPAIQHYRSHRDATPPCRIVVKRNLSEEEFKQALRDHFADLSEDFELCKVNGQRQIIPLPLGCLSPDQIFTNNVLGRSALYIRVKVDHTTTTMAMEGSSRPAHTTTTMTTEGSGRLAHTSTTMTTEDSNRPAHTATTIATEGSGRPAHTPTTMATEFSSRPAHTTTTMATEFSSRPAHTTTTMATEFSSRPAHTTTTMATEGSSRPAHTTTTMATEFSSRPAHTTTTMATEGSSRPAHTTTTMARAIQVEDFYMDSSESDIEEVAMVLPVRSNSPDLYRELPDILKEFREDNLDLHTNITVIARRKHILRSACMALSRGYFEWHKVPNIEFVGEMAEDYGGPRREFFRLLMIELQSTLGVFEGKPGELLFSYNLKALEENKFYTAGRLMAWSIIHNGPGIRCINKELFLIMCGQKPNLAMFDLANILDSDNAEKLTKVVRCSTSEELRELKNSLGDWICDCGVPSIFTASLDDLTKIYGQLVTHHIYHRVASMIQQFTAGMNSCGRLWEVAYNNWEAFLPLFTNTRDKLSRMEFKNLFEISWSTPGSNKRDLEEETIFQWECWLMSIQEGDVAISFEDVLAFVTAADSLPPMGFDQSCRIEFYAQEPQLRRIPYASTCALTLYLPRGVAEEDEFKDLMLTAIQGSLGFGKV